MGHAMRTNPIMFDTHQYVKRAKDAGFNEKQAEFQAEELVKIIDESLATKQDLKDLEGRLTHSLTLRFGYMLIAALGYLSVLLGILALFLHK